MKNPKLHQAFSIQPMLLGGSPFDTTCVNGLIHYLDHSNELFSKQSVAEDFSLYIHKPTATDPSFAPPDCESFYALCPVPSLCPTSTLVRQN